jgi:hypothetical protein
MDGDIIEFSTVDLTDVNKPEFANVKSTGEALKISFKNSTTVEN